MAEAHSGGSLRAALERLLGPAEDVRATRRLLLAGLGAVYLVAFVSLGTQLHGLVGENGILPNARYFEGLAAYGAVGFADAPTLCWWLGCSDPALSALVAVGAAGGALLVLGVLPLPAALAAWVAALSLFYAGQVFLSFQWDLLLLEAGFLGILLAPPRAWDVGRSGPPRVLWWLPRWLLFRLMFSSGAVKLASGDPSWRGLEALSFHYETQPIPTWTSWWMHQLPGWAHELSTLGTFAVELLVPWLYFAPWRPLRLAAALVTASFMAAIGLTGNYGFFNLLTAVLCLSLVDDRALPRALRRWLAGAPAPATLRRPRRPATALLGATALAIALAGLVPVASAVGVRLGGTPLGALDAAQRGLRLVNGYGLFASMTRQRPELVIEGRRAGGPWRPYRFRWKPGPLDRAPRFAGLHMPRLDWQMWFAALGGPPRNPWLAALGRRLLDGEPAVLALLEADPFGGARPDEIRVVLYDYRFTDRATRAETGNWWRRQRLRTVLQLSADPRRPESPAATSGPEAPSGPRRSAR